jgi:endoglucanase
MARVERLLEELTNAYGPSGFEGPVRAIMREQLAPLADHLETDGIGSLIARVPGSAEAPRVMLAAHMDEVGALVKYVTPEGFVKFQTVGGWLDQGLINQRFVILTRGGVVNGVTGLKTPHVMQAEERTRLVKSPQMFIDVGAKDRADAEERLGILPGDPIVPDSRFMALNGGRTYLGKAWDNRVGLAVMVEVVRRLKDSPAPNTIFAVSTVQEEVGLRGAHTSSHRVAPDVGVNLESGVAGDFPGITQEEAQERLGDGPGIFLHDSSMLPNLKLRDLCLDVAKERGISVQMEVLSGYGEDGAEIQRAYSGAPAITITVPTRYLHNHNGIIHRDDFDRTVDLVEAVVRRLDAVTVEQLRSFD